MGFLTAYKKVDNFIKDSCSSDNGVTTYIDMLQKNSYQNWYGICWEDTLKKLKYYRYIRNQIAHDDYASEESLISEDDIRWLEQFYSDLLNTRDPLALRAKKERQIKAAAAQKHSAAKTAGDKPANVDKTAAGQTYTDRQSAYCKAESSDKGKPKRSILKRISDFFRSLFG